MKNITTDKEGFNQKFVSYFVNFIPCDNLHSFKKSLLTATLKENFSHENPGKSLVYQVIQQHFEENEIKNLYPEITNDEILKDNEILNLYFENLDAIKNGFSDKISNLIEKEGDDSSEKIKIEESLEEIFSILKNVRDGNPWIESNAIFYKKNLTGEYTAPH